MDYTKRENHSVQFNEGDEQSWSAVGFYKQTKAPLFVQLLMKHAPQLAPDSKRASQILVLLSLLFFVLSIFLYLFLGTNSVFQISEPISEPPLCRDQLSPELRATMTAEDLQKVPYCIK
jgi:hypothetical protein